MGKGRRPCCDKAGVKKGPWSEAEDVKLISFIQKQGHSNWRALPKLAGLARCGKSCRLRWINYLRPDIKRGNFTPQEEETIIKLHEALGNKWSKIASHFPGRTDNEIKNVWNTHLKKRIKVKEVSTTMSKDPLRDEVLNKCEKDCSQQILINQTSSIDLISEQLSSPSTSYCTQASFSDNQMGDINPTVGFDKGVSTHFNVVEDICDMDGIGINVNEIKDDLVDGLIDIPFEPNLDLWDLLGGDSNLTKPSEVQFNEHEAPLNPITTHMNKNYNKEGDGSWWWLVYLENELGLFSQ